MPYNSLLTVAHSLISCRFWYHWPKFLYRYLSQKYLS